MVMCLTKEKGGRRREEGKQKERGKRDGERRERVRILRDWE